MAQNNNHNFFSKMFFFNFSNGSLKINFRSKQKIINWSLKWRLCDMKIIKWNSQKLTESKTTFDIPLFKNFEPYITWLTQRLTGSRILFLYTTTDCTHSLNCVGVLPVIFLPSLRPRNYIYLTSARSSVQNLSFTTRRRFALLRLLREIKNSKKLKKYIFA